MDFELFAAAVVAERIMVAYAVATPMTDAKLSAADSSRASMTEPVLDRKERHICSGLSIMDGWLATDFVRSGAGSYGRTERQKDT
jgi:hypothetical protein